VPPVLAEFGVVQPAELVGVMVEPVGGALHLVKVMTVLAGGRFLLAPLTHNAQLFAAQLDDLVQRFFQIHDVLLCVTANSCAGLGGRSVAVTMALFLILTIQLAVLLPPVPHFLAVLVHLQPVFQLLGAALLLGGRVPLFLLLVQRLKLTFEGVIAGPGRLVGVRHAGLQWSAGAKDGCRQAS
jgi:hypothetical protein